MGLQDALVNVCTCVHNDLSFVTLGIGFDLVTELIIPSDTTSIYFVVQPEKSFKIAYLPAKT